MCTLVRQEKRICAWKNDIYGSKLSPRTLSKLTLIINDQIEYRNNDVKASFPSSAVIPSDSIGYLTKCTLVRHAELGYTSETFRVSQILDYFKTGKLHFLIFYTSSSYLELI